MKKQLLYSFAAMASLVLASCAGDYDDWASPQTNEEQAAVEKFAAQINAGTDANLTLPTTKDTLRLQSLSSASPEVVGFSVRNVTLEGQKINAFTSGNDICVLTSEYVNTIRDIYQSRAYTTRTPKLAVEYAANLANGDAVDLPAFEAVTQVKTVPTPAEDAKGYYLLGQWQNWDATNPTWMQNNGDGTYTATVTTGDGDNWFKFYQGSHFVSGDWDSINQGAMGCAVNGDNSLFNYVVWPNDPELGEVQTPVISGGGTFEITLDINNYTYTVKRAEARYYVVGNPQGWSDKDMSCMFYAHGGNIYSYTTQWSGAWDLKIWDAKNFGIWENAWGTAVDGDGSASGSLINKDSKSFQAPTKGEYYTLTINMNDNTYSWEAATPSAEYTSVSLIGDFNGWGGDIDLQQVEKSPHNWYARVTIESAGGLKFRANHDWTVNWGSADKETPIGETYYFQPGGENINVPAGTYDFYLNDITGRWSIVPVE